MSKTIEKLRNMPFGARVGLALVLVGILLPTATDVYYATRDPIPVDVPVSLVPGTIHKSFLVNYPGRYRLSLEFEPKIPRETIHCMLGIYYQETSTNCSDTPRIVGFHWTLRRSGEIVRTGDSILHDNTDQHDTVEADYAGFELTKGNYEIELNVSKDASALAVTNPHLRVEAATYREAEAFSLLLLVLVGIGSAAIGGLVMIWSYHRNG